MRRSKWTLAAAAACFVALTAAGCGGSDSADDQTTASGAASDQTPTAGETTAICSDLEALQASGQQLKDAKLERGQLASITQDLADVTAGLTAVKNDAAVQYSTQIDAIQKAADAVSASLDTASTSPSAQTVVTVGKAVQALGASIVSLESAVKGTC